MDQALIIKDTIVSPKRVFYLVTTINSKKWTKSNTGLPFVKVLICVTVTINPWITNCDKSDIWFHRYKKLDQDQCQTVTCLTCFRSYLLTSAWPISQSILVPKYNWRLSFLRRKFIIFETEIYFNRTLFQIQTNELFILWENPEIFIWGFICSNLWLNAMQ